MNFSLLFSSYLRWYTLKIGFSTTVGTKLLTNKRIVWIDLSNKKNQEKEMYSFVWEIEMVLLLFFSYSIFAIVCVSLSVYVYVIRVLKLLKIAVWKRRLNFIFVHIANTLTLHYVILFDFKTTIEFTSFKYLIYQIFPFHNKTKKKYLYFYHFQHIYYKQV